MVLLQIDSLSQLPNNPGFWDNFLWPLLGAGVIGIVVLIWNFLFRKKVKIRLNYHTSYKGTSASQGNLYVILNTTIINQKNNEIVVNVTTDPRSMCHIRNGIVEMTHGGNLGGGVFLHPAPIQAINDVLYPPINISADSNVTGNIVIEVPSLILDKIQLQFAYSNSVKTKNAKVRDLIVSPIP